jgi:heme/copper-type cytochrome/quinol oxidase subunit 2
MQQYGSKHEYSAHGLFLLVIVFLIVYLILTFYNPEFVQRKVHGKATGEQDQMVVMIWALVISVVILFLLALLAYAFTCYQ